METGWRWMTKEVRAEVQDWKGGSKEEDLETENTRVKGVVGAIACGSKHHDFSITTNQTCQLVNIVSRNRYFKHVEDQPDFVLPERYQRQTPSQSKSNEVGKGGLPPPVGVQEEKRLGAPIDDANATPMREVERDDSSETVVGDSEASESIDRNLVDWYSSSDPENPKNWTVPRKVFVTFCICLLTISIYLGSSIYTPGLMGAEMDLGVGQVPATLGLSMFVFGYACGPLVLAPLSEIPAVGRNLPYQVSLAIFVILQVPTALTNNYAGFIILRFLAGFFGSPVLATGGATLADMFVPETQPFAMGIYGLSAAAGPALGPLISGFAIEKKNWHWFAWEMLWLSGATLVFLFFMLPETSSTNILVRRARRLRKLTGNWELKSQGEIDAAEMTGGQVLSMTLIRPATLTVTEPIVIACNLFIAYVYAILYCWFEAFPIVFEMGYGFSLGISGLPYLSILVGSVAGYLIYAYWNYRYFVPKFRAAKGELAPEARLTTSMFGALCYPACLFWFAWSANRTHWIVPTLSAILFGIGTDFMFLCILTYLPDSYPEHVASVLASNDFTRSIVGGAFPLFAGAMFKRLGIAWGTSLLGFISLGLLPIPFVLIKFGPRLRAASKRATSAHS